MKWTAERFESFVSDHHGRDHEFDGELALDEKGKFLAVRFTGYGNIGAYLGPVSPLMSTLNVVKNAVSVYKHAADRGRHQGDVHQHGAGLGLSRRRPPRGQLLHGAADRRAAAEMGIDRLALRRRNQIKPSEIPYKASSGMQYDSGDFPARVRATRSRSPT